ncbi:hypothetical protein B9Z55_002313 [Caenorhabditis nigoni]|uniref:U4/U6.U5 small nuclear ribonucleoprotein 27 kDa protein n=2 Tax=Caenorhabditis nigoni TaxID=1611254 RepID=A0A2G5VJV8_9PELO|nr:hypothetical protein B9Z55_002313 [Caenorhabditis nigoni]
MSTIRLTKLHLNLIIFLILLPNFYKKASIDYISESGRIMGRDRSRSRDRKRRSRSRSIERRRERSRSRDRERRDGRNTRDEKERKSSRSRSPRDKRDRRERSRSRERKERDRERQRKDREPKRKEKQEEISLESVQSVDDEAMMAAMGFGGFNTTKNKQVNDNVDGCVNIKKPRRYRQYMNRKGGFNRPLDFMG